MGTDSSDTEQAGLVERLRAAGCVFAEAEAELLLAAADSTTTLRRLADRRVEGEPLEQVLGWAAFCGLRVAIVPGVFVPRRRTEFLVEQAVAVTSPGDLVLDLCCGCGAIGLAIAAQVPGIELHAAELDPVAAACAQRNLGAAPVHVGDLFAPVPDRYLGRYAVVAANVPYVPTADIAMMPPEARLHEPVIALDGGADGLDLLRRVAAEAPRWLRPDGVLIIETSDRQSADAVVAFEEAHLAPSIRSDPELGATVVVGVARRD